MWPASIGSARRGDCNGPGYFQTDLSFYKNFRIGERARFQFRWDIFNVFNNTNFLLAGLDNTFGVTNVTYDSAPGQATTITKSDHSALVLRKTSFTMRERFTPARACSTRTRTRDSLRL